MDRSRPLLRPLGLGRQQFDDKTPFNDDWQVFFDERGHRPLKIVPTAKEPNEFPVELWARPTDESIVVDDGPTMVSEPSRKAALASTWPFSGVAAAIERTLE
jgi:hypothetical protein